MPSATKKHTTKHLLFMASFLFLGALTFVFQKQLMQTVSSVQTQGVAGVLSSLTAEASDPGCVCAYTVQGPNDDQVGSTCDCGDCESQIGRDEPSCTEGTNPLMEIALGSVICADAGKPVIPIQGVKVRMDGTLNVPGQQSRYVSVEGVTDSNGTFKIGSFPWSQNPGIALKNGWLKPSVRIVSLPATLPAKITNPNFRNQLPNAANCATGAGVCHDPTNVCSADKSFYNSCNMTGVTDDKLLLNTVNFVYRNCSIAATPTRVPTVTPRPLVCGQPCTPPNHTRCAAGLTCIDTTSGSDVTNHYCVNLTTWNQYGSMCTVPTRTPTRVPSVTPSRTMTPTRTPTRVPSITPTRTLTPTPPSCGSPCIPGTVNACVPGMVCDTATQICKVPECVGKPCTCQPPTTDVGDEEKVTGSAVVNGTVANVRWTSTTTGGALENAPLLSDLIVRRYESTRATKPTSQTVSQYTRQQYSVAATSTSYRNTNLSSAKYYFYQLCATIQETGVRYCGTVTESLRGGTTATKPLQLTIPAQQ